MPERAATRLLIIGWDAADWQILDPLLARGEMPALASLIARGVRSDLATLEPRLSPLLWTAIATGRTPDRHGITNFVEPKPDGSGLRIASSTSRRVKALWNIASQSGLRAQVTGWYASHPAEPICGSVTSNLLMEGEAESGDRWPLAAGVVHPDSLAEAVAHCRVRREVFRSEHLHSMLPSLSPTRASDARLDSLCKLMAVAASVERAGITAMRCEAWDLSMVFFETIDTVGHQFMEYRAPRMKHVAEADARLFGGVMDAVYRWHDAALARLLAEAGPDPTVLLVSDHGFHSGRGRPYLGDLPPERRMEREASWHRPIGVLVAAGPGIKSGAPPTAPTILDVAPTALALLGLPAGKDFAGRALGESLACSVPERIESWEDVEGDAGLHPPETRQNPYEAADAIQQLVDLGYMAALPADAQGQIDLVRRESSFNVGVHLLSRGLVRTALPHFEQLVSARPQERRYVTCLAACLLGTNEWERARELLTPWLEVHREDAECRLMLARAFHGAGDTARANALVDQLVRTARATPELLLPLSDLALRLGRAREAMTLAKWSADPDPAAVQPLLAIARACLAESHWEQAAESALKAMEHTKALPEGHYLLGLSLAWYGDRANAERSVEFALALDPAHTGSMRLRAGLAAARGAASEALTLSARARDALAKRELAPAPHYSFEGDALAAHLGVDQDLFR